MFYSADPPRRFLREQSLSLRQFRSRLKTELFNRAYIIMLLSRARKTFSRRMRDGSYYKFSAL